MASYNFGQDLKTAQATEKTIAEYLKAYWFAKNVVMNNTSAFDIQAEIGGKSWKMEVKEDIMSGQTGNVAVEYFSRGKPSGIDVTESDLFIYVLTIDGSKKYFAVNTKALRRIISEGKYFKNVTGGDPGSETKMYLFKMDEFVRHGKFIN